MDRFSIFSDKNQVQKEHEVGDFYFHIMKLQNIYPNFVFLMEENLVRYKKDLFW